MHVEVRGQLEKLKWLCLVASAYLMSHLDGPRLNEVTVLLFLHQTMLPVQGILPPKLCAALLCIHSLS